MIKKQKPNSNREFYSHVVRNISDLNEYENNPNTHDDKNISELANSIQEFGFTNPILIDESDMIIAGHGRLLAAKHLGMSEVPCIVLDGLTDVQKRAYVIADNSLPYGSVWDEDKLAQELEQLELDGFDLDLLALDNIDDLDLDIDGFSPPKVQDGHVKDKPPSTKEADTKLVLGEYSFPIPRAEYLLWQEDIRATAGFDSASVISEIKRRLGICLD